MTKKNSIKMLKKKFKFITKILYIFFLLKTKVLFEKGTKNVFLRVEYNLFLFMKKME
jgi:hypothetical protein